MNELINYPVDKESYYLLVMLYCANVNSEETEAEIAVIKSGHSREKYNKVYSLYESLSDYDLLQILIKYKDEYLLSDKDKTNLMSVAKAITEADERMDPMEKEVLNLLKILLNNQN